MFYISEKAKGNLIVQKSSIKDVDKNWYHCRIIYFKKLYPSCDILPYMELSTSHSWSVIKPGYLKYSIKKLILNPINKPEQL